jgi:hypothetical protein
MARTNKQDRPSQETVAEAARIARATQRPGQSKEQTKLIAQGIQKGIDQYKKQQKAKARELDKRRKKTTDNTLPESKSNPAAQDRSTEAGNRKLPWILLALSWLGFGLYLILLR